MHAEMDLIRAKIEYADKPVKRKLYSQLIEKFDLLIEMTELEMEMPAKKIEQLKTGKFPEPILLKLKSERVASQIKQQILLKE